MRRSRQLQVKAVNDLCDNLCGRLVALGFTAEQGRVAVSPRHMAVEITGLETALPDAQKDRRGPRTMLRIRRLMAFVNQQA